MGCLYAIFGLMLPRMVLIWIWFFRWPYFEMSYKTWYWPLIGWFLMPYTTLVYLWAMVTHEGGTFGGFFLIAICIAVMFDISSGSKTVSNHSKK